MKRYRFTVGGICQGVGFRWTSLYSAQRHQLTGTVRNMSDQTVTLEAQGSPANVSRFLDDLQSTLKKRGIRLEIDTMVEIPLVEESEFKILY